MNITHIKDSEIKVTDNPLQGIFQRQTELHWRYKSIEEANGLGLALVKDRPFSLDDPKWQYVIKDFAWRITEEMAEAVEAYGKENNLHTVEELIDALHFYTELLIMCGIGYGDISPGYWEKIVVWSPVYQLGLACNFLKCKPWKNTHVITDAKRFNVTLIKGYRMLLSIIMGIQIDGNYITTIENVYMMYFKKSLVNQFRIDSNY